MHGKYAYLAFDISWPFPRSIQTISFDAKTQITEGSIKSQIEQPDSAHWGKWLGSLAWENLCEEQYVLSSYCESQTPKVLDHENQILQRTVGNVFRLIPLLAPLCPPNGDVHLISGRATLTSSGCTATDVRSYTPATSWTRSYYNEHCWDEFHAWANTNANQWNIQTLWPQIHTSFLEKVISPAPYQQIVEAFRSFEEGMKSTQLEFKIPNLVRAIESIVHCWGREEFCERTLLLTGQPDADMPFAISQSTDELLKTLYHLRNDCSHGKPLGDSIKKQTGVPAEGKDIAKYEFLAEWACRKLLHGVLLGSTLDQHLVDRDTLETAWNDSHITSL